MDATMGTPMTQAGSPVGGNSMQTNNGPNQSMKGQLPQMPSKMMQERFSTGMTANTNRSGRGSHAFAATNEPGHLSASINRSFLSSQGNAANMGSGTTAFSNNMYSHAPMSSRLATDTSYKSAASIPFNMTGDDGRQVNWVSPDHAPYATSTVIVQSPSAGFNQSRRMTSQGVPGVVVEGRETLTPSISAPVVISSRTWTEDMPTQISEPRVVYQSGSFLNQNNNVSRHVSANMANSISSNAPTAAFTSFFPTASSATANEQWTFSSNNPTTNSSKQMSNQMGGQAYSLSGPQLKPVQLSKVSSRASSNDYSNNANTNAYTTAPQSASSNWS